MQEMEVTWSFAGTREGPIQDSGRACARKVTGIGNLLRYAPLAASRA